MYKFVLAVEKVYSIYIYWDLGSSHRKREERLRKALQARERVEQMEEEKRKRMEQKFSQHEERSEKVGYGPMGFS